MLAKRRQHGCEFREYVQRATTWFCGGGVVKFCHTFTLYGGSSGNRRRRWRELELSGRRYRIWALRCPLPGSAGRPPFAGRACPAPTGGTTKQTTAAGPNFRPRAGRNTGVTKFKKVNTQSPTLCSRKGDATRQSELRDTSCRSMMGPFSGSKKGDDDEEGQGSVGFFFLRSSGRRA